MLVANCTSSFQRAGAVGSSVIELSVRMWTSTNRLGLVSTGELLSGSSGSIVSDYGLDDRVIEVQSPAEAKGFFL
jgi:hypothetical protein